MSKEKKAIRRRMQVLIADDHELFRDAVRQLLTRCPASKVAGEAAGAAAFKGGAFGSVTSLSRLVSIPERHVKGGSESEEQKRQRRRQSAIELSPISTRSLLRSFTPAGASLKGYKTRRLLPNTPVH